MKGKAEALHGDVPQRAREWVLKRFRDGKTTTLVATDVASRGLDIPRVNLIVQIEPPRDPESYIHRSGRTARAGNQGICITLCDDKDRNFVDRIVDKAGVEFKEVTPEEIKQLGNSSSKSSAKSFISGKYGLISYSIEGSFSTKKEAYNTCCDSIGSPIVNKFKSVTMMSEGNIVCFDVEESFESDFLNSFKKSQSEGSSLKLKKLKSKPNF